MPNVLKMISFALRRHFTPQIQAWRCIQPLVRPPNCLLMKAQERHFTSTMAIQIASTSQLSTVCKLACTNRLSVNPLSCLTSRLCHTNQPSDPKEGSSVPVKESFNMRVLAQAPKPALYLGFGGLLPFLAAPILMAATQAFYPEVAFAQVVYGASIVSFLGGARWGFAIPEGSPAQPDWKNLGNSVVPSLLAWLALLCRDDVTEGALVVLMGLGLSLHYDLTLLPGYPGWFKAMRTVLTLVATFSLVATLTLKKLCTEKKIKELQN